MAYDRWRMGFHLMPPTGWLNDPNGLCQFRGTYHVFHQYSPDWPQPHAPRGWGHFTSDDLVHWRHHGMVIRPDTPEEASGSYSGSAIVVPGAAADGGDRLRLYYTGNVKEVGDFDFVHEGRRSSQLLIETDDGYTLGEKRLLLTNDDYPPICTRHVRDPKVWRDEQGTWWMVLGARDTSDTGFALIMRSEDGLAWRPGHELRADEPFGFMWECPDRIVLDGRVYLSACPQGMQDLTWANGVRDQAGYFPVPAGRDLSDPNAAVSACDFRLWDAGFDFYAPQTFVDDAGRTILIGWMGVPEVPFDSAPHGLTWCHCLTVPRVLGRAADGAITQQPAHELSALRRDAVPIAAHGTSVVPGRRADLELTGIEGTFAVTLDGALAIAYDGRELSLSFADSSPDSPGAGRTRRAATLDTLHDLRILVDSSAVEVFAESGRVAMATRWFPTADALTVGVTGTCAGAQAWLMGDGMVGTY